MLEVGVDVSAVAVVSAAAADAQVGDGDVVAGVSILSG